MNKNKVIRVQATQKQLEKAIKGGIKNTLNDHGQIDQKYIESATKRIYGHMKQYMNVVYNSQ